jgi:hypothetical protein
MKYAVEIGSAIQNLIVWGGYTDSMEIAQTKFYLFIFQN